MIEHKITVPLVYHFTYLPTARHSKGVRGIAVEKIVVTIRESDLAEMPVAARRKVYSAPGGKESYRLGLDGFYSEVHASRYSGRPNQYLLAQELREFSEEGSPYNNALLKNMDSSAYERYLKGEGIAPDSVAKITSSKRDEAFTALMENARNLMVVDGIVLSRSEMPVYYVRQGGGFYESYITVEVGDKAGFKDKPQAQIFPLNQFEDMKAYATSHFNGRFDDDDRVEILIPQAFDFDDIKPATLELLSRSMQKHQASIGYADKQTAEAWFDFRDQVHKAMETKSDADIGDAIERGNCYRNSEAPKADAIDLLDEAIKRWDNRAVTGLTI